MSDTKKDAPMPEILRLPVMYMQRSEKRMDDSMREMGCAEEEEKVMLAGVKYAYYHGVFECAKAMYLLLTSKDDTPGAAGVMWLDIVRNE